METNKMILNLLVFISFFLIIILLFFSHFQITMDSVKKAAIFFEK
jgi:hypothetical protein